MKELHIVTVGISLLTNFARTQQISMTEVFRRGQDAARFLEKDPTANCAEINSLDARAGILLSLSKGFGVAMVHSQTEEGQLAAKLIGNFLKKRSVAVAHLQMNSLELPAQLRADPTVVQRMATQGLSALRDKVIEHITRMRQRHPNLVVQLNCTGGYKAECAVLYELGRALRLPVYYLHETFKVAVELP